MITTYTLLVAFILNTGQIDTGIYDHLYAPEDCLKIAQLLSKQYLDDGQDGQVRMVCLEQEGWEV